MQERERVSERVLVTEKNEDAERDTLELIQTTRGERIK